MGRGRFLLFPKSMGKRGSMKNDLAFVIDFGIYLYEHQSTINPNMPYRMLQYLSEEYERLTKDANLYRNRLVKIPTPHFVVFYNGVDEVPERQVLKLSDAYMVKEEFPQLELQVLVLNINDGYNKEVKEQCQILEEYMQYVNRVRRYRKDMQLVEAVDRAVDECIREGILRDFLLANRAEVKKMSIYEYDDEATKKLIAQDAYEDGMLEGIAQGISQGETRAFKLNFMLIEQGRNEDLLKVATNEEYRNQLYDEFGL